jgi:hypothetical protein
VQYEHKGSTIQFDAGTAKFSAKVGGKFVQSSSLAAIKKSIDKAQEFEPFNALRSPTWQDKKAAGRLYVECRVVGIERARGKQPSYRRAAHQWTLESGANVSEVWIDTPENRAAIEAHYAAREAERERHNKEEERLREMDLAIQTHKFPE